MKNDFFFETVTIANGYRPGPGNFAKTSYSSGPALMAGEWIYCREIWHQRSRNIKFFFFTHVKGRGKGIALFMTKIEQQLNVKPRSAFGPTQRKTIMWCRPSIWWTATSMRRSLFTILMRCATAYIIDKDNFQDTLLSTKHTRETKYAVSRFLQGYTRYTGKVSGWHNQFSRVGEAMTDKLLVKPV